MKIIINKIKYAAEIPATFAFSIKIVGLTKLVRLSLSTH